MATEYPHTFPLAELRTILEILKAGDYLAHRAELAKAIWLAQGYALRAAVGEPGHTGPPPRMQCGPDTAADAGELAAAILAELGDTAPPADLAAGLGRPVDRLINYLMKALLRFLDDVIDKLLED